MRYIGLELDSTDGCLAFPLAIDNGLRTLNFPGQGGNPFPNATDFEYPSMATDYYNFYFNHPPIGSEPVSILQAQEGYIFKVDNPDWLVWNEFVADDATTLSANMSFPGRSGDYTVAAHAGMNPPGYGNPVYGYFEPGDPSDEHMHENDLVRGSNVNGSSITGVLNGHIDNERTLRFIVYDTTNGTDYTIERFGIFRILGYNLSAGTPWLLVEFVNWDTSCGQS